MDMIAEEIDYYKANRKDFIEQYEGKFLVIKGKAVAGIYNSRTEAQEQARRQHEAGTYIIEHPLLLKQG